MLLLVAAGLRAQELERGPLVLNINVNGSLIGHVPFFARQLTATESFFTGTPPQTGSLRDVSSAVTWTSSNTAVLAVTATGALTSPGTQCAAACNATITATYGRLHASVTFTIYAPQGLVITNVSSQPSLQTALPNGDYQIFAAYGTYADNFLCSPPPPNVPPPTTGCYIFKSLNWTSSNAAAVKMNANGVAGLVRAIMPSGSSLISCTLPGTMTLACTSPQTVTTANAVLSYIFVTPHNQKVGATGTLQYTATGHYTDGQAFALPVSGKPGYANASVTWSTSGAPLPNGGTATITPTGLATAVADGVVFITATPSPANPSVCPGTNCVAGLDVGLTGVSVTPPSASIAKGTPLKFTANGTFSDATPRDISQSVNWTSSDNTIAKVDATGNATAVGQPSSMATLSAFTGGAACPGTFCGQAVVTVTPPGLTSIAVTPATPAALPIGSTQQFKATGTYTDGSTQNLTNTATWNSSSMVTATISNAPGSNGLATAKGLTPPSTNISAAYLGKISPAVPLNVVPAELVSVSIAPKKPSIPKGKTQQFTAKGHYTDGSVFTLPYIATGDPDHDPATLSWNSSDTSVATIDSGSGSPTFGLATSVTPGATTIQATSGSFTPSTVLTVTAAALQSISITPADSSIPQNTDQQFTATGTYTDQSTQDLTASATWTSGDTSVASFSSSVNGLVSGVAGGGPITIIAQDPNSSTKGTTMLTVTPRTLTSISVTPNPATLNAGQQQQFTAMGTYDAPPTPQDITQSAAWTSDNTAVATVNMSTGLASALVGGTANIKATVSSVSGTAALNVNNPSLLNISVTPQNATIRLDFTQQYTATGNYSDGSTQDLSDVVVWSEATGVGSIDPTGLYTPSSPGPDTVTAACSGACLPSGQTGNVSASADLTVTF